MIRSYAWFGVLGLMLLGLFWLGAKPVAVGLFEPPVDKLVHAICFASLFVCMCLAFHYPPGWMAIGSMAVSMLDEVHQLFLPGRQPDVMDWLAGAVGVLLVLPLVHRFSRPQVDHSGC